MTDATEPRQDNAPAGLARKILAIQASVGQVKKKGKFDSAMGGSSFLRIEDAVLAVTKLMTDRGLIFNGTLLKKPDGSFFYDSHPHTGGKGYIATVVFEWTLEDTETGEKRFWHIPGEGYDGTDKATPKAQTSSRKYAIISIFNLAVGNDVEAHSASFDDGKKAQKNVASSKIADAAGRGNKTAIDALSQIQPEKKVIITRPEEHNGHYICAEGYIAVPPLDKFFEDTGCKRFKRKTDLVAYWKVPAEYEKGLIDLCLKLGIEVEG